MFNHLTNEGMLDRLFIDWCTYKNKSVWKSKEVAWKKWIRL